MNASRTLAANRWLCITASIIVQVILLFGPLGAPSVAAAPRPNILFIIVDDQSPFDLKVYNPRSELQTPNIDRLAAEGVVFDGAYHMGSVAVSGVWDKRDERTIRNELGREFACGEDIDIQIGRVLKKLEAMGELDNTYIFYTADHGMAIGRHGLQGKQNLYQHTWRVPFIAKGPGVQSGVRAAGNIYLLDVLTTLCDLAGIEAPKTNEGISFKPVLEGKLDSVRDVLYGVYCGGAKPGMRCIKSGHWKLIKYDSPRDGVRETQLFNLAENPHELLEQHHDSQVASLTGVAPQPHQVNLAGDPRYADKLAELESLLLAEMRRLDDPYRLWNQPDDGLAPPDSKAENAPKRERSRRAGAKEKNRARN